MEMTDKKKLGIASFVFLLALSYYIYTEFFEGNQKRTPAPQPKAPSAAQPTAQQVKQPSGTTIVDTKVESSIANGKLVETTTHTLQLSQPKFLATPPIAPEVQEYLGKFEATAKAKIEKEMYDSQLKAYMAKLEHANRTMPFSNNNVIPKNVVTSPTPTVKNNIDNIVPPGQPQVPVVIQQPQYKDTVNDDSANADFANIKITSFIATTQSKDVTVSYLGVQYPIHEESRFGPFKVLRIGEDSILLSHRPTGISRNLTQQLIVPQPVPQESTEGS